MWAGVFSELSRRLPVRVRRPFLWLAQRLTPQPRGENTVEGTIWPRAWAVPVAVWAGLRDAKPPSDASCVDQPPAGWALARAWHDGNGWRARLVLPGPQGSAPGYARSQGEYHRAAAVPAYLFPKHVVAPLGVVVGAEPSLPGSDLAELARLLGYRLLEERLPEKSTGELFQKAFPSVSILLVTHNRWEKTELCLRALVAFTQYPSWEVVAVDNASSDGTADALEAWSARVPRMRVIRNRDNRGFPAACNQAASVASGEVLCVLNNDTVVGPGWLCALVDELIRNPRVGLVGPTSQGVANEARVKAPYRSMEEFALWAMGRGQGLFRRARTMRMLALFCAATWKRVWVEVGGLDEDFGLGLFEDDDFSYRLRERGYELRCRLDAFVHHFQGCSFSRLDDHTYWELYERNRRLFWAKLRARRRTR